MKEIKAIVQASKLQKIHDAFYCLKGFPGISAARVDWFGPDIHRPRTAKEELTDFSRKTLFATLAPDELVDEIVRILIDCTYTGSPATASYWLPPSSRRSRSGKPMSACLTLDNLPRDITAPHCNENHRAVSKTAFIDDICHLRNIHSY